MVNIHDLGRLLTEADSPPKNEVALFVVLIARPAGLEKCVVNRCQRKAEVGVAKSRGDTSQPMCRLHARSWFGSAVDKLFPL